MCQECAKYKKGEQCEDECPTDFYADEDLRECIPCADECRGCSGPGADNCIACRNYRIYPVFKLLNQRLKYAQGQNKKNKTLYLLHYLVIFRMMMLLMKSTQVSYARFNVLLNTPTEL